MKGDARHWGLVVGLAALWLIFLPAPALAADPVTVELQAPQEVELGGPVVVTAVLRDGQGEVIPGATVILRSSVTFFSTQGEMNLGQAVTDAQGRATFIYEARSQGGVILKAYFLGDSRYAPAQALADLKVLGSGQLYRETAGMKVPGIGVWLLAGLLGIVWSIYFIVMVLLTRIAGESPKAPGYASGGHRG